jgi:T3SS negative regulator,GrlR
MKNGLYSVHVQMGDGVRGRASGVIMLRDGVILGGDPYFWSTGNYTFKEGTWKGDLVTNQHTPYHDSTARPVFAVREVTTGFSGTYRDDNSEVFGTSLVGSRSISFRATLQRLADN